MDIKEIAVILLAAVILGISFSFPLINLTTVAYSIIFMLVIIAVNVIAKKLMAYAFDADANIKLWSIYQFGFPKASHFRKPIPMIWLPLFLGFISRGFIKWFPILEFDIQPRVEKASRRYGLWRFSEMNDADIAKIAVAGIFANLIIAIIAYLIAGSFSSLNLEQFARWNIYFAFWSLIPISSLDGSKILFGSKGLWVTTLVITSIFLGYALLVI